MNTTRLKSEPKYADGHGYSPTWAQVQTNVVLKTGPGPSYSGAEAQSA